MGCRKKMSYITVLDEEGGIIRSLASILFIKSELPCRVEDSFDPLFGTLSGVKSKVIFSLVTRQSLPKHMAENYFYDPKLLYGKMLYKI